ncbi:unnamed protein product, partial [Mesorhabditis belari]|uniref:peptide-methionine (S)-S-oxide reductase n=1 Tax=Mesorhabditis belari TaxID=2138241 RepID=A0AAF3F528_9BILA
MRFLSSSPLNSYLLAVRFYSNTAKMSLETAYFGMQCFWGVESSFAKIRGVKKTRVGYAGGTTPNPNYRDIGDHTEITEVRFDPAEVDYRTVLAWFWKRHDSTEKHKKQYQSAILYTSDEQKAAAEETAKEVEAKKGRPLDTYIQKFDKFYQAEDYHQKYWLRGRGQYIHDLGLDNANLADSYLATKLNAYLAGYTDFTELDQLAAEHKIPEDLITDIKEIANNGGDPRNCHH